MKQILPILFFSVLLFLFLFLSPKTNQVFAATTTLTPSADAMILSNNGNGNYGGNTLIDTSLLATGKSRMLMKFNIESIPANATINSAALSIKFYGCGIFSEAINDLNVTRIKSSWTEYGVTWNTHKNVFDFDNELNYVAPCSTSGSYLNYNVKTLVNNWRSGEYQNYGFGLFGNEGAAEEWIKIFYSKENTSNKIPKLIINYSVPGSDSGPEGNDESLNSSTSDQGTGEDSDSSVEADGKSKDISGSNKNATASALATPSAKEDTTTSLLTDQFQGLSEIRIALLIVLILLLIIIGGGYLIYREEGKKSLKAIHNILKITK